jgi:hypothetical protein
MSESSEALVPKPEEAKEVDAQGESKQPEVKQHNEADPIKDGEGEVKQLEFEDHKTADSGEGGSAESKQPESDDHKLAEPEVKITGDKGKEHQHYQHHNQTPYQAHYHKHFPHTMEKLEDIKEKLKEFNARYHKIHGKK